MIEAGKKLPPFKLIGDDAKTYSSKDLAGQRAVLFIYPKDMTPGCTQEACDFRDALGRFSGKKVRIVGLSKLGPESKRKFKDKHSLPFLLLSDPDQAYLKKLGVVRKKNMYGKMVEGIERTTVIVSAAGKVEKLWHKVKVAGHVEEVLAAL